MLMAEQRRLLCEYGRRAVELGLVIGSSGNLSARAGDLMAVTPAGVPLDRMTPEECPILDMDGRLVAGEAAPSSETPMHLAVYHTTDARAVVHTHSVFGTVVATTMRELPAVHYNILLLGGRTISVADYATYGTPELAENVERALAGRQAALLANHGGVTIGGDLAAAFEATRLLEWLCEVYVRAKAVGEPRVLSSAELDAVTERTLNPPAFQRAEVKPQETQWSQRRANLL